MATFAIGDVHGCVEERRSHTLPARFEGDHQADVGDMGARGMRVAPDREAADERPVAALRHEDGGVWVATDRLEEAPLVSRAPPLAGDADQPALRLGAHSVRETGQLLRVGGIGVTDPEAHASTTTAAPPLRGSPAPASEPSSRISTAETPPKKRLCCRQRTTG